MARAMRSFTEPHGSNDSSFANTAAAPAGTTRRRRTTGVPPTASRIDSSGGAARGRATAGRDGAAGRAGSSIVLRAGSVLRDGGIDVVAPAEDPAGEVPHP